jgi:hypothetical protein
MEGPGLFHFDQARWLSAEIRSSLLRLVLETFSVDTIPSVEDRPMLITLYLDEGTFDSEITRVMGGAFERALAALRISDPSDHIAAIVARRILALSKNGERNADHLCDQALASLGVGEYYVATEDGTFRLRRLKVNAPRW